MYSSSLWRDYWIDAKNSSMYVLRFLVNVHYSSWSYVIPCVDMSGSYAHVEEVAMHLSNSKEEMSTKFILNLILLKMLMVAAGFDRPTYKFRSKWSTKL